MAFLTSFIKGNWIALLLAVIALGAFGYLVWDYSSAKSKVRAQAAEIDTLQDTVIEREKDIKECGRKAQNLEQVANDKQIRINALNKSIAANKLRISEARCIPILR